MIDHIVLDGAALLVQGIGSRVGNIALLESGGSQGLGEIRRQLCPLVQRGLLVQRDAVGRSEHGHDSRGGRSDRGPIVRRVLRIRVGGARGQRYCHRASGNDGGKNGGWAACEHHKRAKPPWGE